MRGRWAGVRSLEPLPGVRHGTSTGYREGCGCPPCREAHRKACRQTLARRDAASRTIVRVRCDRCLTAVPLSRRRLEACLDTAPALAPRLCPSCVPTPESTLPRRSLL